MLVEEARCASESVALPSPWQRQARCVREAAFTLEHFPASGVKCFFSALNGAFFYPGSWCLNAALDQRIPSKKGSFFLFASPLQGGFLLLRFKAFILTRLRVCASLLCKEQNPRLFPKGQCYKALCFSSQGTFACSFRREIERSYRDEAAFLEGSF